MSRGFWKERLLIMLLLLLGALLLLSPLPSQSVQLDEESFNTAEQAAFDPFGLLNTQDGADGDAFGPMADMRIMHEAMQIIDGVEDLSDLSDEQLKKLQDLGIDPQTVEQNKDTLRSLVEADNAFDEAASFRCLKLFSGGALLLAALLLTVSLIYERNSKH